MPSFLLWSHVKLHFHFASKGVNVLKGVKDYVTII
jgi:hypothetical protein